MRDRVFAFLAFGLHPKIPLDCPGNHVSETPSHGLASSKLVKPSTSEWSEA